MRFCDNKNCGADMVICQCCGRDVCSKCESTEWTDSPLGVGHFWRCGDRDEDLWNWACDYVINLILVDEGFTPPKGCLLDSSFRGMSAEEVYNKLLQKQQQQKQQGGDNGSGPGKPGQGRADASVTQTQ